EGKVQTSDSGWSVMLTVYEGELRLGERVLELPGEDCRAHDETLALVVALLLEHGPPPAHESAEIDSEPAVAEPKISDLPKAESPPSVGSLVEHPEKKVRARVGPGVRALGGLAPSLVWGPTFLAGLTYLDHWAIDVQGDFYAPGTDQLLPS